MCAARKNHRTELIKLSKSIYSLVLDDEVIREIDRLAYAEGMSRSALINRVLAQEAGLSTVQMRTRDIFRRVEELLTGNMLFALGEPSESAFQMRSALAYKYNPTVRYTVALGGSGGALGELRVQVRSRSDAFTLAVLQFFRMWEKLENLYIGASDIRFEPNRLVRRLIPHNKADGHAVSVIDADALAAYIGAFDGAMKAFFSGIDRPSEAAEAAEAKMAEYVKNNEVLM